jgi:hypothetical protein
MIAVAELDAELSQKSMGEKDERETDSYYEAMTR